MALAARFTNRELRTLAAPLLDKPAEDITAGQMTYELRRLSFANSRTITRCHM